MCAKPKRWRKGLAFPQPYFSSTSVPIGTRQIAGRSFRSGPGYWKW